MPQLTVVTPKQFINKAWKRYSTYFFAAQSNLLPVAATELPKLVPALPLGFVQTEDIFQLVALTSLQPGINLCVAPDGRWIGDYVPAALRAHPFRLVKPQDREDSILCIDESSGLVVDAGLGEAFFDQAGNPSASVKEMIDFLSQTERDRVITQVAVNSLRACGLIQPWPLSIRQAGETVPVNGVFRVDEAALNSLDADTLHVLRDNGALPLAYGQLFSLNQLGVLENLRGMHAQRQTQTPSATNGLMGMGDFKLRQDDSTLKFN